MKVNYFRLDQNFTNISGQTEGDVSIYFCFLDSQSVSLCVRISSVDPRIGFELNRRAHLFCCCCCYNLPPSLSYIHILTLTLSLYHTLCLCNVKRTESRSIKHTHTNVPCTLAQSIYFIQTHWNNAR